MIAHPGLISTADGIFKLAQNLKGSEIIAFDTEFIRETTFFPIVEVIQIATETESWLVDARAFQRQGLSGAEALKPLWEVFSDPKTLKIAHAAQSDQECLFTAFGVVASPSLDTAVAASLCGYGDGIGLSNLLKSLLGVNLKKGHARTDWSVRPLPPQLEEYAHADVEFLVEAAKRLLGELEEVSRKNWALELSAKWEDRRLYEPNPEELAVKLTKNGRLDRKGHVALTELIRWREDRVRALNLPRRWVADDNVLMDLAQVRPKDISHLAAFRGLNKGELKNSGQAILDALKRASELDETQLPKILKPEVPTGVESQVLDLLRCYIGILADRYRIASKYLVTAPQLLPLLRSQAKTAQDLVTQGLLTEGASQLIGQEVIAMLSGRRALSVERGRVKIVSLEDLKGATQSEHKSEPK